MSSKESVVFLVSLAGSIVGTALLIIFPPSYIAHNGIHFIFRNTQIEQGTFADGSPYVIGPIQLIGYSPAYSRLPREINGAMLNLNCGSELQGFDSAGNTAWELTDYDSNLNIGKMIYMDRIQPTLVAGDILVVGESNINWVYIDHVNEEKPAILHRVGVLHVLAEHPTEEVWRNGYCKVSENNPGLLTKQFRFADLDLSSLGNLTPLSTTPEFTEVLEFFNKLPWFEGFPTWVGDAFHPTYNMPYGIYGREYASAVSVGAMYMQLDTNIQQKTEIARYMVQIGIDNYYTAMNGGDSIWRGGGGHTNGRKFPIIFAGIVLNDPDLLAIGERSGDYMYGNGTNDPVNHPDDYIHFGEDDQTFIVRQWDVDQCNSARWSPDDRAAALVRYEQADVSSSMPEWNTGRTNIYGYLGNKHWITPYRRCCTANSFPGFVLATRIMGGMGYWNHPALFLYQDRYMTIENGGVDPYGAPGTTGLTDSWRCLVGTFTCNLWEAYRSLY